MEEEWKEIEGYHGYFSVSNFGRIRNNLKNTIPKPYLDGKNIFVVSKIKEKRFYFQIKSEVVKAFICANYNNKKSYIVNIDGNVYNNNTTNLEVKPKVNKYKIIDNYVIGYTIKNEMFYFDLEDFEDVECHIWYLRDNKYIVTNTKINGKNKIVYLHIFIMNKYYNLKNKDIQIDHIISKNKTDNRKSNLRLCTQRQNIINRGLGKINTSGIIGVGLRLRKNKNGESKEYWRAYIKNNGKCISKQFKTKEEAIKWRLQKELELFGKDFAPQRHLFEEYRIYSIDNIVK